MPLPSDTVKDLKKKENRFTRFILPGFLAVLIHLSFFGFKKATPADNPDMAKPKRVMFLPQNTVIVEEQRLLAWMEMLDPTYFTQPNRKYGYSRTYNAAGMPDIPLELDQIISPYGREGNIIPVPWKPRFERIKDEWPYRPAGIEAVDISKFRRNFDFPVWMSETDNAILPQLFGNLDKLKDILKQSPPESPETVLKVDFFGPNFFPKVKILHSCGNSDLDTMALKTLTVRGKRLAINDKDSSEPCFITVKWYVDYSKE